MAAGAPRPPSVRWEVLLPLAVLGCLALYGAYRMVLSNIAGVISPPKQETEPVQTATPDDIPPRDFSRHGRKEETPPPPPPAIPQGQVVQRSAGAAPAMLLAAQQLQASTQAMQAQTGAMERLLAGLTNLQPQQATPPARPQTQAPAPVQAKPRGTLKMLIDNTAGEGRQEATKDDGDGKDLIHRAKWAIPVKPRLTLYRSMQLPTRTLDAIVSEIPGQVRLELTVPIFDRFEHETMILPKGSVIVAMQQSTNISYGQNRIPLKLEQIELPTGEVISLKADIGDANGAQGLTGKVDNKIGKLLLATGLSAILNIGVKTAAGTPGRNQYYQDPIQSAAQDIGQSVQRDAQSIIDRELRVKPVITIPAQTIATINILENYQFNHQPTLVR